MISSHKIHIRQLSESDATTSVTWRNDPTIWKYTKRRPDREITIADETAWIKKVTSDPGSYRCAIVVDNIYIGNIYLTDIENISAQFHIFIGDKEFEGQGVAQYATQLMLDYARDELQLSTVYLEVHQANSKAIHIYKKIGFSEDVQQDPPFITMRKTILEDNT